MCQQNSTSATEVPHQKRQVSEIVTVCRNWLAGQRHVPPVKLCDSGPAGRHHLCRRR